MARSQLLKDIVGGQVSIENILLRLKIILTDLDNEPIMNWINGELQGYKNEEDVPKYRILKGTPKGTFVVNSVVQYTNANVPLHNLITDEMYDSLITLNVKNSITSIQNILNGENRDNFAKSISTELSHAMSTMQVQITGMSIRYTSLDLEAMVSNVKSKLVDIVMELEKQFDNLDDMDIKDQIEESSSKRDQAVYNIEQIIYEGSIEIGDKNKISKSILGHLFGGGKE
ncbi:hypothetical protein CQ056_28205 [Peribacillus simplex]|uniref:AbiTii domain-containing protein n=1 Tax=Peribacillus TaxID=2675229 RepID=UPI000D007D71|nr:MULTISPECIES: hypothetical protein [Peribacillus]MCF7625525.1 hypothetical protein [Peribacillus frigoritolerans]PRA73763.1 hypothetical protein CQ056_28205 [Peribacillus simplex]